MLSGVADNAESIDDIIVHKFGVAAADYSMMEIVVSLAVADVRGKFRGKFVRTVAGDEIDYVVGNQCRKPAHAITRDVFVLGDPNGGSAHDLDLRKIAPGFFGAFFHETQTPFDEMRICKLKDHAIPDPAGASQGLRSVARDPDWWNTAVRPTHLNRMPVVDDLLAAVEVANNADGLFE